MIEYKKLQSMSDAQFYSFASCTFDNDCGYTQAKYESDEQIVEWFKSGLTKAARTKEYTIDEIKRELEENLFWEDYPFDGDEYISCLATYNAREEEKNVPFFEKNLPLLNDEHSKVYPNLRRIVYQEREFEFVEDSFNDDRPNYILNVRELRMSFDDYVDKILIEQTRLTKAVVNLSSPD